MKSCKRVQICHYSEDGFRFYHLQMISWCSIWRHLLFYNTCRKH